MILVVGRDGLQGWAAGAVAAASAVALPARHRGGRWAGSGHEGISGAVGRDVDLVLVAQGVPGAGADLGDAV